jgi:hypothetical protein
MVVVFVILLGVYNGLVVELGWWRQIFNGETFWKTGTLDSENLEG